MEAPKSLSSYTCYTVYFVYCVHTKNEKQEIGGWIHLQKTIVFHFYQKQFLPLLFLFLLQDFDFMTPFKAFRNTFNIFPSSVISWSQARPDSKGAIAEEKKRNEKKLKAILKKKYKKIGRPSPCGAAGKGDLGMRLFQPMELRVSKKGKFKTRWLRPREVWSKFYVLNEVRWYCI